ncbi:MAG: protein translocase subunit SecF [Thiotrichaceae bacterium]|nr:protein translocase subunit SecF [Thiotrichaceae bacterium]
MKQNKKEINFMSVSKIAMVFSAILLIGSLVAITMKGLALGVDFTGGTVITVTYPSAVKTEEVKSILEAGGFKDLKIQHFGSQDKIRIRVATEASKTGTDLRGDSEQKALSDAILTVLKEKTADVKLDSVDFVGGEVGDDLRDDGGLAMIYALAGILVYVAFRFEFRFSVGAIVALVHDVVITLGFFAITGFQFDLTVLAAILAIIGYSLNDTIVVFDRIRENFRLLRKRSPVEVINSSVNMTLSRTIVTSLTTLIVLAALFFMGGESVHAFSLAMIVGVIVGTYSSIFVASSSLLMMGITKEALMPVEKEEGEEGEEMTEKQKMP